eukprot:PLAT15199.1.p1 GENE.PLAT15199.1~~PLAT15199.1.p1  ORF type:complete len:350 (-),score=129.61 PLAT15199.1:47-1096(-)
MFSSFRLLLTLVALLPASLAVTGLFAVTATPPGVVPARLQAIVSVNATSGAESELVSLTAPAAQPLRGAAIMDQTQKKMYMASKLATGGLQLRSWYTPTSKLLVNITLPFSAAAVAATAAVGVGVTDGSHVYVYALQQASSGGWAVNITEVNPFATPPTVSATGLIALPSSSGITVQQAAAASFSYVDIVSGSFMRLAGSVYHFSTPGGKLVAPPVSFSQPSVGQIWFDTSINALRMLSLPSRTAEQGAAPTLCPVLLSYNVTAAAFLPSQPFVTQSDASKQLCLQGDAARAATAFRSDEQLFCFALPQSDSAKDATYICAGLHGLQVSVRASMTSAPIAMANLPYVFA